MALGGYPTARPIVPLVLVTLLALASFAAALKAPVEVRATDDPIQGKSISELNYRGMNDPRFAERVQHFLADHGAANHPQKADLQGLTPLEAARATLTSEVRGGRTPVEWIQLAKADNLLSLRPTTSARSDLVADITHLDAAAGAPLSSTQRAQLARDVAAMQPDLRAAFAPLVHAVAVAYDAQIPIAQREADRVANARTAMDVALPDADREASLQNTLTILAAENAFRDAARAISFPTTSTAIFRDPTGLVIIGSTGNDVYTSDSVLGDPILTVDPSGDDTYLNSAAGACPLVFGAWTCNGLVASTLLDISGNDWYEHSGFEAVQGAGSFGGLGLLVDATGDDHYQSSYYRTSGNPFFAYVDAGSQGQGAAGVGILLDATGNDWYESDISTATNAETYDLSQGFGDVGGLGILADGAGDNKVLDYGHDTGGPGFQGLYEGGTGMYGGLGIFASTGSGNSQYHGWDNSSSTDFYAWGFAGFGGTGIFFDDGGNDDYAAVEDSYQNTVEIPLLNCAFGTASFAGLGIFVDLGGNDQYYSDTTAVGGTDRRGNHIPGSVFTQSEGYGGPDEGEGLFVDASGDDGHFMMAHPDGGPNDYAFTTGRGVTFHGGSGLTGNTAGVYLDLGGHDTYAGAAPSKDNAAWIGFGADLNTDGSVPGFSGLAFGGN